MHEPTSTPSSSALNHMPSPRAVTPRRMRSVTLARSSTAPLSLYTRTRSPSAMPRSAASFVLIQKRWSLAA